MMVLFDPKEKSLDDFKTCVTCRFHKRKLREGYGNSLFEYRHECHIPGDIELNLITGERRQQVEIRTCSNSRDDNFRTSCGREGKNWQPKKSWLRDKGNLFTLLKRM